MEGGVQVLRADNLAPVSTLPTVRPRRLAFLDDQRLLLLSERQISVVDAASGHCFCKEVDNYDDLLAVSPDGLRCAVRIDEHVVVRDTQHLREINRFRVFLATDCAFSHDAGLLACTRFGEPHVELWHIDSATLEDEMRLDARPAALAFVGKKTLFVAMRDGSAETVKLSLTAREREHQAAREFSEREEHARDCLRQLAMRTAPGYRDSPGREYLDADGLGLRLPGLEDHQATLRIAMDSDTYNIEIRVGATGAQPAPRASFVRLARWIRTRLHPPAPAQDPRDAQFISELESTASIESARVDRVKGEALTIEIRSRTVPDPEAMRQWVARGLELSREQ